MSSKREPAHQVVLFQLHLATVEITKENKANPAVVKVLLDSLSRMEMKTEHAHEVAASLVKTRERLTEAGQLEEAEFAHEVITELRDRKDEEKKPEQSAVRTEPTTSWRDNPGSLKGN